MRIPFRLLLAHARRRKLRTALTVGSVFVAILIFGLLRTFIVGMQSSVADSNHRRLVVSSAISLFANLPKRLEPELRALPHVKALTHWTWYGGIYIDNSTKHRSWARFGVDVPTLRTVYGTDMELSEAEWTKFLEIPTACVVGEDLAVNEGFAVGQQIPLTGNFFPGQLELQVVGIYKRKNNAFDANSLFFHWNYMNERSKKEGGRQDIVSTFSLLLDDPAAGPALTQQIDAAYESSDNRTRTLTERQFQAQFASMWGDVPNILAFIGTIVMIACLMVTANTMVLNARERVQEVGILKTLGFAPQTIALMTLVEGLLLCLVGGAAALALVRLLDGKMMMFIIAAVPLSTILEGLGIATALGLLSGIVPAWIAGRMNIVEAIRRRA